MMTKMEESEEGQEILRSRPRINTNTVNFDKLRKLPEGTFGKAYSDFLEKNVSIKQSNTITKVYCRRSRLTQE